MLTAFTLNNFKSYREARLPLAPLTVLIGANASGKSNAIEGLRLLSWLAQGHKLSAIGYAVQDSERVVRGRIETLALDAAAPFGLGCDTDLTHGSALRLAIARRQDGLHIVREQLDSRYETVPLYVLDTPSQGRGSDAGVAYNNFARGGVKPHVTCSDQTAIFTQLDSPTVFRPDHKQSRRVIPETVGKLQTWLANILFLDPAPSQMRDYSFPSDGRLLGDGRNLSGVLFGLWGGGADPGDSAEAAHRAAILAFIQSLPEQDIRTLTFLEEPRGGKLVELVETFGGTDRAYDASLLSDGTLRVLAIAAAMLSAPEGSLVVIEEIDNGVHPSRAHHLLAQIQTVAEQRSLRVLLSTHNPALLDALPDAALPNVVFCYRQPDDGTSRLVRLAEIPDYPELMAQGSLGRLMTSGALERFVKFHPGPRRRKEQALEWLAKMRAEHEA